MKQTHKESTPQRHKTKGLPHTQTRLTAAALPSCGENETETGALRPAARHRPPPHPAGLGGSARPPPPFPPRSGGRRAASSADSPRAAGWSQPRGRHGETARARTFLASPRLAQSRPFPPSLSATAAHPPGSAGPSGAAGNKFSPRLEEKPLPRHRGSSAPPALPPSGPQGWEKGRAGPLPSLPASGSPAPAEQSTALPRRREGSAALAERRQH